MAYPEPSGHELRHIADADAQAKHDEEIADKIISRLGVTRVYTGEHSDSTVCPMNVDCGAEFVGPCEWMYTMIYEALRFGREEVQKEYEHSAALTAAPKGTSS